MELFIQHPCSNKGINHTFSEKGMVNAFDTAGMLDEKFHRCPDLKKIIESFKVNWDKVPGGQNWFLEVLPTVVGEMFEHGEVSEEFYDAHYFPMDCDTEGKICRPSYKVKGDVSSCSG